MALYFPLHYRSFKSDGIFGNYINWFCRWSLRAIESKVIQIPMFIRQVHVYLVVWNLKQACNENVNTTGDHIHSNVRGLIPRNCKLYFAQWIYALKAWTRTMLFIWAAYYSTRYRFLYVRYNLLTFPCPIHGWKWNFNPTISPSLPDIKRFFGSRVKSNFPYLSISVYPVTRHQRVINPSR